MANVLSNLESHLLGGGRQNVKRHLIHSDGCRVLLLMVIDVSHVHPDSSCKLILFAFYYFVVFGESLL